MPRKYGFSAVKRKMPVLNAFVYFFSGICLSLLLSRVFAHNTFWFGRSVWYTYLNLVILPCLVCPPLESAFVLSSHLSFSIFLSLVPSAIIPLLVTLYEFCPFSWHKVKPTQTFSVQLVFGCSNFHSFPCFLIRVVTEKPLCLNTISAFSFFFLITLIRISSF